MNNIKFAPPRSKTSAADSPIVEDAGVGESNSEITGTTCNWQGNTYGLGDVICINGQQHKCKENGWVAIGFKC